MCTYVMFALPLVLPSEFLPREWCTGRRLRERPFSFHSCQVFSQFIRNCAFPFTSQALTETKQDGWGMCVWTCDSHVRMYMFTVSLSCVVLYVVMLLLCFTVTVVCVCAHVRTPICVCMHAHTHPRVCVCTALAPLVCVVSCIGTNSASVVCQSYWCAYLCLLCVVWSILCLLCIMVCACSQWGVVRLLVHRSCYYHSAHSVSVTR